jgi:signal transduction histidine kinase
MPAQFMNTEPSTILDWRLRREAAVEACGLLTSRHDDEEALSLVISFAADSKWEVRKVVAEALASLPETLSQQISAEMAGETHAMVEAAIRRSISRRQLGGPQPGHEGLLQDEFEKIKIRFGPEAAEAARKMAEKSTALHIRAAVHDIRNIITYLRPSDDLLKDSVHKRNVNRITTGRDYLRRMLDMMDNYTSPLSVKKSTEPIREVIEESSVAAREQIRDEGFNPSKVEVINGLPEGVDFSVARLEIVIAFSNLIKNAIEAHGRKDGKILPGKVKIGGDILEGYIRIHIQDFGHGLSQVDLDGLLKFIPGKTSKRGGSGYGLPLCNRYISAHGGRLDMDSREDKGTIASVLLPILNASNPLT